MSLTKEIRFEKFSGNRQNTTKPALDNAKQAEIARDIADSLLKLRTTAKQNQLKFLTYFLEMAFHEAFSRSILNDATDETDPSFFLEGRDETD